nr:OmpA family protein [Candidatus Kapabacteria bacterium]
KSPSIKELVEEEVIIPEGPGRERRIILKFDDIQSFSFPRSNSTQLTEGMKLYLDKIADYLKRHPNARIRVVGHSDDLGSTDENERRARERADNVVNYLVRNKINRRRILDDSKGARDAAVAGFTDAARRSNRRVEVTIIR